MNEENTTYTESEYLTDIFTGVIEMLAILAIYYIAAVFLFSF